MISILGTGQVGRSLCEVLGELYPTAPLRLFNRSGRTDFPLPPGVTVRSVDVTRAEALTEIFREAEIVCCCTDVPYPEWGRFYLALSAALVAGLRGSSARLVLADNLYSYGDLGGAVYTEDLPHAAATRKGRIRAELLTAFAHHGVSDRVAVVKASDFIGPRIHKGVFGVDFLHRAARGKTVFLPGRTDLPHAFTYIGDLARAMALIAFANDVYGQVWHVPGTAALPQRDWIDLFETALDRRIRYRSIPPAALAVAGWFSPFAREVRELGYQFNQPYLLSAERFTARFGDIATPPHAIVRETMDWFTTQSTPA
ncbi:nucleoside-diphosphate-sugar epimerase [Neolewinella xylanilytica]|uniref:Nucleoside-diphosphate-sugar epimerase n=1 Tax=Neolewinella xylanilytica TaxID=1514080 RepID=A0A2S6I8F4_9BACT|nr:hypothetical protein [Neolewinella xylanilytica]PPK87771.1 nucleoside-diphosphate-sugar epimerase [Neolewinella xylanilytica]